jgi:predicted dehydrogenase
MRVAVLGSGHLGREHARVYAAMPDVELLGVFDTDPERAAAAAEYAKCPVLRDRAALLEGADAVSICVPTPAHAEEAAACLEAGLHVLIEKPITTDVASGRRICELARQRERVLQVGHVERFNPAMLAAAPHLARPRFIESQRLAPFGRRGADVAVVLDLMIHDLDLVLACVDDEVESVDASGVAVLSGNTDIANARVRFRNGCVANLTASRISMEKVRKIRFFQPDRYVSVDLLAGRVGALRARPGFDAAAFQAALQRGENPDWHDAIEPIDVRVEPAEPLQLELAAFVRSARDGTPPWVSGEQAVRALEVAVAVERALAAEPGCAS